ncbi:PIG-L family deacetylase [Candidatus Woesearchaeota archaeon]|nr:PIG-L family deacetylase [Candidatus Woesearchaeota archaeon]
MAKKENILVICSHTDDHIIGAGGTIANYINEGKKVLAIVLSHGEKSHPWLKERFTRKFRAEEAQQASQILGCDVKIMEMEDTKVMQDYPKFKQELLKTVSRLKPAKIFTHNNEDPHPDHRAAYQITLDLVNDLPIKPEVYLFSVWSPLTLRKSHLPKMYVDISQTFNKKLKAIKCFQSQRASIYSLISSVFVRAVKNGLHTHTKYAEKFYKLK